MPSSPEAVTDSSQGVPDSIKALSDSIKVVSANSLEVLVCGGSLVQAEVVRRLCDETGAVCIHARVV